jgi:hypothetical protein
MWRTSGAGTLIWLALASLSCSCSDPSTTGASNCFTGLTASSGGQSVELASCAGLVGITPFPQLTVHPGDAITIDSHGTSMFSAAVSNDPSVVVMTNNKDSVAKLKAARPGTAVVALRTTVSCLEAQTAGFCPALTLTVDRG